MGLLEKALSRVPYTALDNFSRRLNHIVKTRTKFELFSRLRSVLMACSNYVPLVVPARCTACSRHSATLESMLNFILKK